MSTGIRRASVSMIAILAVLIFSPVLGASGDELPLRLVQCIEAALANNRDIIIERMNLRQARGEVTRAWSTFDPYVVAESGFTHTEQPAGTQLLGADVSEQESVTCNVGLEALVPTGGMLRLDFQNERTESNSYFQDLNPQYSTALAFTVTHPLLQGAGKRPNLYRVKVAKNNLAASKIALKEVILQTVSNVEDAYWNLVLAGENLRVSRLSRQLAGELLHMTKTQVRTGILPPVATLQAEASAASREEAVLVAENTIQTARRELLRVMNALDGKIGSATLVPMDRPVPVKSLPDFDKIRKEALRNSFQLRSFEYQIHNALLARKVARNALLPRLDLLGSVGIVGLAGNAGDPATRVMPTGRIIPDPTGSSIGITETVTITDPPNSFDGNYGDALGSMFADGYVAWSVGLQVRYPLGNRMARSDYSRALLEEKKALLQIEKAHDLVKVFIENLIGDLETAVKRVEVTAKSAELAKKNMKAEEKKFKVGISTNRDVLEAQEAYAKALIAAVQALIDYNKSRGRIERARMGYIDVSGATVSMAGSQTSPAMGIEAQGGLSVIPSTGSSPQSTGLGSTSMPSLGSSLMP